MTIEAEYTLLVLPPFHRDPFDRLLEAQACVERLILLTAGKTLSRCAGYAAIQAV